jgi:hypothetical protein
MGRGGRLMSYKFGDIAGVVQEGGGAPKKVVVVKRRDAFREFGIDFSTTYTVVFDGGAMPLHSYEEKELVPWKEESEIKLPEGDLLKWYEEEGYFEDLWSLPVHELFNGQTSFSYGIFSTDGINYSCEFGLLQIGQGDSWSMIEEIIHGVSIESAKQACVQHFRAFLKTLYDKYPMEKVKEKS